MDACEVRFPGKWLLDGLIELPFALPTAVAGITLSKLYSGTGFFGKGLGKLGIDVAYTQAGIVVALVFVGIPFVIRAVQPVLERWIIHMRRPLICLAPHHLRHFLR